jgi:hypothetical protein
MGVSTTEFARVAEKAQFPGSGSWFGSLAPGETPARLRPWAYEELLLGSSRDRAQAPELSELVGELETERGELAKLHQELDRHLRTIEDLEGRLRELTPGAAPSISSRALPRSRTMPAEAVDSPSPVVQSAHSLARCEGFRVDSPIGPVGFVEGIRFVSRIDEPDLLEVRGGRFGRELLLIPIEAVAEVSQGGRSHRHPYRARSE